MSGADTLQKYSYLEKAGGPDSNYVSFIIEFSETYIRAVEITILVIRKNNRVMIFRLSGISAALTFDLRDEPASSGECLHGVE